MIKTILYRVRDLGIGVWGYMYRLFMRLGWLKGSATVAGTILVIAIGFSFLRASAPAPVGIEDSIKSVEVASVSTLSSGGAALSVAGFVQSVAEATVRAEKSAEVTHVYRTLGDFVSAGTIVAELENASERAVVLQAQGALQAAEASANVSVGTLLSTKDSSIAALLSTYGVVEKVVHTDIDPMFSNPESNSPIFNVQSADSQAKTNAEGARGLLSLMLKRHLTQAQSLSTASDLVAELNKTESEVKVVRDYLDTIIRVLNAGIATNGISENTIATHKATATAARSTITTSLSTLITTRLALETIFKTSAQGSGTVSATQAAITSAQGTLASARANLERTIIRAPISGTINSLSLERGNFIQAGSPVLVVANNKALEVITYITPNDAPRIAVGGKALLDGEGSGIITKIAPALDPLTKKIEVRVGLSSDASTLINGQSVVVTFEKPTAAATKQTNRTITIPIAALKIGSENIVVFTVDSDNKLVAHQVVLGTLLGERVEIRSGLTDEMYIVTDARGLQAGEVVRIKN